MSTLKYQLDELEVGESRQIRGKTVSRDGDSFIIDGKGYSASEAISVLEQRGRRKSFPYDELAFVLVKPPSRVISTHKVTNRSEHVDLIKMAQKRGLFLYYATVEQRENKYYAKQPWIVDWESVPEDGVPKVQPKRTAPPPPDPEPDEEPESDDSVETTDDGLSCPFCGKTMSSTPGRTLHVKSKHPDKLEEYRQMIK